jgi:hypothetical protein
MASRKLAEIAKTIRSKNAGVDKITFDVIFPDRTSYAQVRESGVLSREFVCRIFGIAAAQISDYVEFDPALAIKFTIYRRTPSGSAGDADIFAASNMVRYSISRSREVETPRARARSMLDVGCGSRAADDQKQRCHAGTITHQPIGRAMRLPCASHCTGC